MGSFATSCGLTRQTINEGEEVYIIPISPQISYRPVEYVRKSVKYLYDNPSSFCYSTDLYLPLGFMFEGKYDSYGGYNIDFSKRSNQLLFEKYYTYLQQNTYEVTQGENSVHEKAVNFQQIPFDINKIQEHWETIHQAIWQNRLLLSNRYNQKNRPTPVQYFIVSKRNADILLKLYQDRDIKGYFIPSPDTIEIIKAEPYKRFELFMKENDIYFNMDNIDRSLSNLKNKGYSYFLNDNIGEGISAYLHAFEIKELLYKNKNEDNQNLFGIFNLFYNLKCLIISCAKVNVYPHPCMHVGQDYQNTYGTLYTSFMTKIHEQNIENYCDEDSEETEENLFSLDKVFLNFGYN